MGLNKNIQMPVNNAATAEMAYFLDVITQFQKVMKDSEESEKQLVMLARSAESCIAKAVYHFREELNNANIHLKIIFNQIQTSDELSNWLLPEQSPLGPNPEQNIRWTKQTSLADAHEQLTFGNACSWSGESMRRDVNTRFGFYMFKEDCKTTAKLANNAFKALWNISTPLPQTLIKRINSEAGSEMLNIETDSFTPSRHGEIFIAPEFTRH